jgi:imidazolonepropionase-like amidohydrolase
MLDRPRASELAGKLDLDMHETGICLACLTFVAFPIDSGNEREAQGATVRVTPILWEEGLEGPARRALEHARERGVENAARALADVDAAGARTPIARAIVHVLALQMVAEMRARLN